MTQIRTLLIGTALTAFASTAAVAQTAQPAAGTDGQAQVRCKAPMSRPRPPRRACSR